MKKLSKYDEQELMTAIRKCDEGYFVCILPISMVSDHFFGCEFKDLTQSELDIIQIEFQESNLIDFAFENILNEISNNELILNRNNS
jgi:hypothetical protein